MIFVLRELCFPVDWKNYGQWLLKYMMITNKVRDVLLNYYQSIF